MAKPIDLNDWTLSGGGKLGQSYFHKKDPSLLLKIDNRDLSEDDVNFSLEIARTVYELGLPTPKPYEVVFDGKHYGLVSQRIQDKVSYSKSIGEHPETIPQLACDFAAITRRIHSTKGYGTGLKSIKETYGKLLLANPFRPKALLEKAAGLLESLPDAETCVHGDLHYGNIIKSGNSSYLIDIGSFSYGHPFFDIAMLKSVHRFSKIAPEAHYELYHCTTEHADEFWHCFVREYFGESLDDGQLERMLLPYLSVRALVMETEAGNRLPRNMYSTVLDYLDSV